MPVVPAAVLQGARELAQRDRVLAVMYERHGPPRLRRARPGAERFGALARMICYQQLAGRAASAIHGRFAALYGGSPTPAAVLATPPERLREVGLSAAKVASILDLAAKVECGEVTLDRVGRLADEEVVRELTRVRGIGEWTAHMFCMFQLGRLDVWPTLDYGVRAGFTRMYELASMPSARELGELGDRFAPYRSLVAWWSWRAVDTAVPS